MAVLGLNAYLERASEHSVVPVYREINADMETPASIFVKLNGVFLLESVEKGTQAGRYSIIGMGRKSSVSITGRQAAITEYDQGEITSSVSVEFNDPLEFIRTFMSDFSSADYPDLPPFWGGIVGYLGYEAAGCLENIPVTPAGEDDLPDAVLIVPETVVVCDAVTRTAVVVVSTFPGSKPRQAYLAAEKEIERCISLVSAAAPELVTADCLPASLVSSSPEREEFICMVEQCREHILAGDIIQGVLSRRMVFSSAESPFALYRRLRRLNPSPYMFYLDLEDFVLTGSSPEVMVKVQDGELCLKPIAGTRPRGVTEKEDIRIAEELLADRKECSEHLMLVDLGRNDLGRVAIPGSVEVTDYMSVERFSHVMHIVSSIRGKLSPGCDAYDVIRASFPAGTLTGAPKIRAMEIVSGLENTRRGPYGGMVLYLGFNGNLDSCITIRSMVCRDGEITVQAGAGIVADSNPESEFLETENKAGALMNVILNNRGGEK